MNVFDIPEQQLHEVASNPNTDQRTLYYIANNQELNYRVREEAAKNLRMMFVRFLDCEDWYSVASHSKYLNAAMANRIANRILDDPDNEADKYNLLRTGFLSDDVKTKLFLDNKTGTEIFNYADYETDPACLDRVPVNTKTDYMVISALCDNKFTSKEKLRQILVDTKLGQFAVTPYFQRNPTLEEVQNVIMNVTEHDLRDLLISKFLIMEPSLENVKTVLSTVQASPDRVDDCVEYAAGFPEYEGYPVEWVQSVLV